MKQLIFSLALYVIPFLVNAQHDGTGNPTLSATTASYGEGAGTTGNYSVYMGTEAGSSSNSGIGANTFIGYRTGWQNTSGKFNAYLGRQAGRNSNGSNNTYLGVNAGLASAEGKRNVFIGWNAGYFETGNDKLIIDSRTIATDKHTPLIYGDFAKDYVGIAVNTDPADGDIVLDASQNSPYGLYVGKGILTEKVKVAPRDDAFWSDYVFEKDYDLNTIEEVEGFIKKNKHLPNVPSAKEVSKKGIDVAEMDATLLRQIEELWLHMIELKKENDALKTEVASCNTDDGDMKETEDVLLEQIEDLKLYTIKLNERIQELENQQDR